MTKIERKHLMLAVLASRDEIDPDLETGLLEAIVNAEADAFGDSDTAMRAIDSAVTDAIERRGYLQEAKPTTDAANVNGTEGEA